MLLTPVAAGIPLAVTAANVSGGPLAAGMPVAGSPGGTGLVAALASATATSAIGIMASTTAAGQQGSAIRGGLITLADWTAVAGTVALVPLAIYYLGVTSGTLTTTPPSGAGQVVQQVGIATSTHTLGIGVGPPIPASLGGLGGSDANYVHNQIIPSASWTVAHNLNKFPASVIVDSAGTVVVGDVTYLDVNTVRLDFVGAFSGKAYFN
jgi:hypothetical protein